LEDEANILNVVAFLNGSQRTSAVQVSGTIAMFFTMLYGFIA